MAQGGIQRAHLLQPPVDGQAVPAVGYEVGNAQFRAKADGLGLKAAGGNGNKMAVLL